MNILQKVTWKAMWKNRTRTIVTIIGVILSAAMFSAVTTAAFSIRDFLVRGYVYSEGDYFVNYDYATDEQTAALAEHESVTQLADYKCLGFTALDDNYSYLGTHFVGAVDKTFFETMPVRLVEGRLPENSRELLLPKHYVRGAEELGYPCTVGETVTLPMRSKVEDPLDEIPFWDNIENETWEATYTIVGIYESHWFRASETSYYSLLTLDDGSQSETLWHRLYAKTADAAEVIQWDPEAYGARKFLHNDLMQMYGATSYDNVNDMILYLAVILMALIMGASVSLIHNAFSISVSERTKQFGLLSSIGATKKQLRKSVFFEAAAISGIGIPIGLLCGYGGIAVVFALLGENLENQFSFSASGQTELYAVFSWLAFLVAALVCLFTVLFSAWNPARRAMKITPLEAIRQSEEIRPRSKDVKVGKLTLKLFGLPGVLAKKYFGISRRKYRATILSLVFSLTLFVTAGYFTQQFESNYAGTTQLENYDFDCCSLEENPAENEAILNQAVNSPGVSRSVLVSSETLICILPTDLLNEEYVRLDQYFGDYSRAYSSILVNLVYLEDAVLAQHLEDNGIDPHRYIGASEPTALVCMMNMDERVINDDGSRTLKTYHLNPFTEAVDQLTVSMPGNAPEVLYQDLESFWDSDIASDSGEALWELHVNPYDAEGNAAADGGTYTYYKKVFRTDADGNNVVDYFHYDLETGTTGELAATGDAWVMPMDIAIGDVLETRPFGVRSSADYNITLILPMSARRSDFNGMTYLRLDADNYELAKERLTAIDGLFVTDEVESSRNARGLLLTIRVCAAGFIILISLICTANVFNTISTNIALRRRDFGMLKSAGMRSREIYRMMSYECIIYGFRAFVWGLPVSLLLCFGLYLVFNISFYGPFEAPWLLLLIGTLCIIAVVFTSMLYAVSKLRRNNPIDAIRMENT